MSDAQIRRIFPGNSFSSGVDGRQLEEKSGTKGKHTTGDIITVDGTAYEYYGRNLIREKDINRFHCHLWAIGLDGVFVAFGPYSVVSGEAIAEMVICAVFWGIVAGFSLFDLLWLEPRWEQIVTAPEGRERTAARRKSTWIGIACFLLVGAITFVVEYLLFVMTGGSFLLEWA